MNCPICRIGHLQLVFDDDVWEHVCDWCRHKGPVPVECQDDTQEQTEVAINWITVFALLNKGGMP